jgi:hypothetical protein
MPGNFAEGSRRDLSSRANSNPEPAFCGNSCENGRADYLVAWLNDDGMDVNPRRSQLRGRQPFDPAEWSFQSLENEPTYSAGSPRIKEVAEIVSPTLIVGGPS